MFNELMKEHGESTIYSTKIGEDYLSDIEMWTGYMTQLGIFTESDSIQALGAGVLYIMDETDTPFTFCHESVCGVLLVLLFCCNFMVFTRGIERVVVLEQTQWGWQETQVACKTVCVIFKNDFW